MNFFEHQDQARRKTGRLVILFVIAVVMILIAVNAVAYGILRIASPHLAYVEDAAPVIRGDRQYPGTLQDVEPLWEIPMVYIGVSLATLLIIGGGSAYKTASLSRGGHAVATLLGGRPLDPHSAQGQDRVLQNVVEEMSIASGVPVPQVYVLENEKSINAFAAGFTTDDAVIGVTRGLLDKLNRDELQGVVAHEFSHILNGDMRLNIRLIGILHGILVIALIGYGIMRSLRFVRTSGRRNDKGGNAVILILLAGAAMLVIGYVGVFFGRLIQAAVSRQREYLADASAVQFTRNPKGIAGALMKIGVFSAGSHVENHHALETAHMFFATGIKVGLSGLLATHPPLRDRIKKIDPMWDGKLPSPRELAAAAPPPPQAPPEPASQRPAARPPIMAPLPWGAGAAAGMAAMGALPNSAEAIARARARTSLDPSSIVASAGAPTPNSVALADRLLETIPPPLIEAAHDPYSARAVVFCLLASNDPAVREKQLAQISAAVNPAAQRELLRLLEMIERLSPAARLPLLDVSLPALRRMSPQQIGQFRDVTRALVEADRRISLFEYALLKILDQNLRLPDEPARRGRVQYYALNAVKDDAAVLLSALANANETDTEASFAVGAKRLDAVNPPRPAADAGLAAVDAALKRLELASPAVKQRVLDACAHTVASDGHISVNEAEMLRAIASTMDIPLPPLVAAVSPSSSAPAELTAR